MPPSPDRRGSRRATSARKSAPRMSDVSRLEFENLYTEIDGLVKGLRKAQTDLQRLADRVHRLERRIDD